MTHSDTRCSFTCALHLPQLPSSAECVHGQASLQDCMALCPDGAAGTSPHSFLCPVLNSMALTGCVVLQGHKAGAENSSSCTVSAAAFQKGLAQSKPCPLLSCQYFP